MWNIINNCPASKRKGLVGLDVRFEEPFAFDKPISLGKLIKSNNSKVLVHQKYQNGNYNIHCSTTKCEETVDHCLKDALSNQKELDPESNCKSNHDKSHENDLFTN